MRVLITRANEEAKHLGNQIIKIGCTPLIASMMEIEYKTDPFDPDEFSAVVTSSQQAIKALADSTDRRDMLLYVVGPASERCAKELGFTQVRAAAGTGKAMVGFIRRTLDEKDRPVCYFRGEVVHQPIGKDLSRAGYTVKPRLAYRAKAVDHFPDDVLAEFAKETPPEVAIFMSIRTYRLFAEALEKSGYMDKISQMTAVCISAAVADFVREHRWKRVVTLAKPGGMELIDTVKRLKEEADAA